MIHTAGPNKISQLLERRNAFEIKTLWLTCCTSVDQQVVGLQNSPEFPQFLCSCFRLFTRSFSQATNYLLLQNPDVHHRNSLTLTSVRYSFNFNPHSLFPIHPFQYNPFFLSIFRRLSLFLSHNACYIKIRINLQIFAKYSRSSFDYVHEIIA